MSTPKDRYPLQIAAELRASGETEAADCIETLYDMSLDMALECMRLRDNEDWDEIGEPTVPELLRTTSH